VNNPYDLERANARMQSYTGKAVLALILYWIFWLPGLIANIMFYQEAKRMEKIAGQSLPGVGCLTILLALNVIGLVLGVGGFCLTTLLAGVSGSR